MVKCPSKKYYVQIRLNYGQIMQDNAEELSLNTKNIMRMYNSSKQLDITNWLDVGS